MDGNETEDTNSAAAGRCNDDDYEEDPSSASTNRIPMSHVHHQFDLVKTKTNSQLKRIRDTLGAWRKEKSYVVKGKSVEISKDRTKSVASHTSHDLFKSTATENNHVPDNCASPLQDREMAEISQNVRISRERLQPQFDSDLYRPGRSEDLLSGQRSFKEPAVVFTKMYHQVHQGHSHPIERHSSAHPVPPEAPTTLPLSPRFSETCEETRHSPQAVAGQLVQPTGEFWNQTPHTPTRSDLQANEEMATEPLPASSYSQASAVNQSHSGTSETVGSLSDNKSPLAVQYYPEFHNQKIESKMHVHRTSLSPSVTENRSVRNNQKVHENIKNVTEASGSESKERHASESAILYVKAQTVMSCLPTSTVLPQDATLPTKHFSIKYQIPESDVVPACSQELPSAPMAEWSPEASFRPNDQFSGTSFPPYVTADYTTSRALPKIRDVSHPIAPSRPAPQPPKVRSTITQYPGPMKGYTIDTPRWNEAQPPPLPPPPHHFATPGPTLSTTPVFLNTEPRPYMPTTEPLPHKPRHSSIFRSFESAPKNGFFSRQWSSSEQTRSTLMSSLSGLASSVRWKSAGFRDSMNRQFSKLSTTTSGSHNSLGSPVDPKGTQGAWIYRSPGSTSRESFEEKDRRQGDQEPECLFGEDIYRFILLQIVCCCCWPIGLASWLLTATVLQNRRRPVEACIHTMAGQLSWYALLFGIAFYLLFMVFLLSLISTSLANNA